MRLAHKLAMLVVLGTLLTPTVFAEDDKGQEDLDKATELKLTARQPRDLERVANLCESAIKKGLDKENEAFARNLLASSLYEHASLFARGVLKTNRDSRWQLLRHFAVQSLEKAIKFKDDLAEAHLMLARLQILPRGDRKRAAEAADKAVKLYKEDKKHLAESLVLRAQLRSKPDERLADLNAAIKANPKFVDAWQARANHYLATGNAEKAIADFEKLIEVNENNVEARIALAEALSNLKRYDDAIKQADKVIAENPKLSLAHTLKARIYLAQEKNEEAIGALEKAIEANPRDVMARILRSELHLIAGRHDLARRDVKAALQVSPGLVMGVVLRSRIAAAEGQAAKEAKKETLSRMRFSEAIRDMRLLVQHDSDNIDWKLQLATLHSADGQPRKAVKLLDKIIARAKGSDQSRALRARADVLLTIGKHEQAIKDYEKAIKLTQKPAAGMLNNLAWVLATSPVDKLRNGKRAIELAKKACEKTEYKAAYILSTLASAYAEAGDYDQAIKWSAKAVELGEKHLKKQLQEELDSYKKKKPWREKQETKEKPDFTGVGGDVVET